MKYKDQNKQKRDSEETDNESNTKKLGRNLNNLREQERDLRNENISKMRNSLGPDDKNLNKYPWNENKIQRKKNKGRK